MNVDALARQIEREVMTLTNGAAPTTDTYRQQATVSVMGRVPLVLSAAVYSADLAAGGAPVGLEAKLASGSGICGNHVELGLNLFDRLGVPVRDVQIYYGADEPLNHTVVEVEWGGGWRMVDLTWGFVPHTGSLEDALGFEAARSANERRGLHHRLIPWRRSVEPIFDIFGYLSEPADAILIAGNGEVRVDVIDGSADLRHPGLYRVGLGRRRGSNADVVLRVPAGSYSLAVEVRSRARATLDFGGIHHVAGEGSTTIGADVSGPVDIRLSLADKSDVVVLDVVGVTGRAAV